MISILTKLTSGSAGSHICRGQFSESLGYYNKAIDLMPYAIEPRLGVVLPASSLGNWDMVIGQYMKILSIDPQ